jgi:hypothetical protein
MKFYRYEIVEYAVIGDDGEYADAKFPNPKLELREFNLQKETPKGYWIGYGFIHPHSLRGQARWVSKTCRKRYAYPTKEEALLNFVKRTEKRMRILDWQSQVCRISLIIAKNITNV